MALVGAIFGLIPILFVLAFIGPAIGLTFGILGRRYGFGKAAIIIAVAALGLGIAGVAITANAVHKIDQSLSTPAAVGTESAAASHAATPAHTPPANQPPPSGTKQLIIPDGIAITRNGQLAGGVSVLSVKVSRTDGNPNYPENASNGYFVAFTAIEDSQINGLSVGPNDFYVVVGGQHYDSSDGNAYLINGQLDYTTLNTGEHTKGLVAFDLPATHGTLYYSPKFQGAPLASWRF